MKKNSTKSLKWLKGLTAAVSIYCCIYIILLTIRAMFYIGWINIGLEPVKWIEGHEGIQYTVLSIWWFTGVVFNLLMLIFAINSTRQLKAGTLFPVSNVGVLFGCAAAHLFYKIATQNMPVLFEARRSITFDLGYDELLITSFICIFAIVYKIAGMIAEENSLTI